MTNKSEKMPSDVESGEIIDEKNVQVPMVTQIPQPANVPFVATHCYVAPPVQYAPPLTFVPCPNYQFPNFSQPVMPPPNFVNVCMPPPIPVVYDSKFINAQLEKSYQSYHFISNGGQLYSPMLLYNDSDIRGRNPLILDQRKGYIPPRQNNILPHTTFVKNGPVVTRQIFNYQEIYDDQVKLKIAWELHLKHAMEHLVRPGYVCNDADCKLNSMNYEEVEKYYALKKRSMPYQCKLCGVRFSVFDHLIIHNKGHKEIV